VLQQFETLLSVDSAWKEILSHITSSAAAKSQLKLVMEDQQIKCFRIFIE